jgi:hypothetical protein
MAYYWCLKHNRVETDDDKCSSDNLLGPYPTADDARHGLERLRDRERRLEAEDAAWSGDEP